MTSSHSASVEEWLKQANQNKINSKNSFNVQLIDYFHSLSKEKSVNFLQVSYTLDGCVKVYTSRVDAVNKESEDLLQGLISSGGKVVKKEEQEDGVKTTTSTSTSKKSQSSSLTLKEDSIKLKKFELIPSSLSDPCFLKITNSTVNQTTVNQKDETIVDKLLMNQLESNEVGLDYIIDSKQYYPLQKKDETIATSMLFDVQSILTTTTTTTTTSNCSICPALKHFDFTKRDFTLDTLISKETDDTDDTDDDDEVVYNDEFVYVVEPMPDLMVLQQDSEEDSECIGFEEDQQVVVGNNVVVVVVNEGHSTTSTKFSVSRNDYDLHLFSTTSSSTLKKNWAGPEHFKLTRILQQGLRITSSTSGGGGGDRKKTTTTTTTTGGGGAGVEFRIDFNNIEEDRLTEDVLFKKTTTTNSTTTTTTTAAAKTLNTTILLPVDLHYGYDDIRRMFLKPKFKVGYQEEEEGDYAAAAAAADNDNDVDYPDHYQEEEEEEEDTNVPFESLQFTQSLQQSHQEEDNKGLNYTKRAKRVDVKKLKDTLWQDIQQQQQQQQHDKEDVSFKKVLQDTELKHTNKNEDITISYYFICLLHLCNEKEMELEELEGKDLKLVVSC